MARSIKDLFPISILQEIATTPQQTDYDISGLKLDNAHYFTRKPTEPFEELNGSDYQVITSGHTQTLRITNQALLNDIVSIQVAEALEDRSHNYENIGQADLTVLLQAFNELVLSYQEFRKYSEVTMMLIDTNAMTKVLPRLEDGEAWVYDATLNEFRGFPVLDLNEIADKEIVRIKAVLDQYIEDTSKPSVINYINTVGIPLLTAHVNTTLIPQLDAKQTAIEGELDTHKATLENQLTVTKDQYLTDLQDKFNDLKLDHGIIPTGTDTHSLEHGRHWTTDMTQLTHPVPTEQIPEQNDQRGYLEVNTVGAKKVIIYYALSGKQFVKMETQSGTWTNWEILGGSAENYINVGYVSGNLQFDPVMWDEVSNTWKRADSTGADGIIVNGHTSNGRIYFMGLCEIPTGAVDGLGGAFQRGEWYFLTPGGGMTPNKPTTGLWQVLGRAGADNPPKTFMVDLSAPKDITPLVITASGENQVVTKDDLTAELLKKQNKPISSLSDLGLTPPVTMQQIIDSMSDGTNLSMTLSAGDVSDYPIELSGSFGVLTIIKNSPHGVRVILTGTGSNNQNTGFWQGFSYNGTWNGWVKLKEDSDPVGQFTKTAGNGSMKVYLNTMFNGKLKPNSYYMCTIWYRSTSNATGIGLMAEGVTNAQGTFESIYPAITVTDKTAFKINRVAGDYEFVTTTGNYGMAGKCEYLTS